MLRLLWVKLIHLIITHSQRSVGRVSLKIINPKVMDLSTSSGRFFVAKNMPFTPVLATCKDLVSTGYASHKYV